LVWSVAGRRPAWLVGRVGRRSGLSLGLWRRTSRRARSAPSSRAAAPTGARGLLRPEDRLPARGDDGSGFIGRGRPEPGLRQRAPAAHRRRQIRIRLHQPLKPSERVAVLSSLHGRERASQRKLRRKDAPTPDVSAGRLHFCKCAHCVRTDHSWRLAEISIGSILKTDSPERVGLSHRGR
jgi:hypothetical protein